MARQVPLELTRNIGIMATLMLVKPPRPNVSFFTPA